MAKQSESNETAEDAVRRQFREALERKKSKPVGDHEGTQSGGKSSSARSNEKSQRMFRRKSGG